MTATHQEPKPSSSPQASRGKAAIYANGLAAVLMFISWLGQNIYQSEMSSRKADIQANVQFVSSEMSKALTWLLTFQAERRKETPDPEVILNSAVGYAKTTQLIVEAASNVDRNSPVLRKHVEDHRKLFVPLEVAAQQRDIRKLEENAMIMMMWFGGIDREAREAMGARFQQISDDEDNGKLIFHVFYLLGSLAFAVTWWKTNVSLLRR